MSDNEQIEKKPHISQEERLALCTKLDKELDEFIEKLPRKKYTDGWPEDRWEEEMEKHPFFMKKAPEPGDELHPLYEGLQKLKYDPNENEPEELAVAYKDDGNFNFKYKKYRMAIIAYTEGIKIKCGNPEIEATLYNNRAAAHYYLKNFRSCLRDCESALKMKPDYEKVLNRAANACYHLGDFEKAIHYCDLILSKHSTDKTALELRKNSINELKLKTRNDRKMEQISKKLKKEEEKLIEQIIKKGVTIEGGKMNLAELEPQFPELINNRVHLIENNTLIWPVVFLYPEYKLMDYLQEFNETVTFQEQLDSVFSQPPEWDDEGKYRSDNLNIYFESVSRKLIKIDAQKTLEEILKLKSYVVKGGTPNFIILAKNSNAEKHFLQSYI